MIVFVVGIGNSLADAKHRFEIVFEPRTKSSDQLQIRAEDFLEFENLVEIVECHLKSPESVFLLDKAEFL
jgi:hypothetical protein